MKSESRALIAITILLTSFFAVSAIARPAVADDTAALALATRVAGQYVKSARVFVRTVPLDFAAPVTLPTALPLIGSVVRNLNDRAGAKETTLYYAAGMATAPALAQFEAALRLAGYRVVQFGNETSGGFAAAPPFRTWCRRQGEMEASKVTVSTMTALTISFYSASSVFSAECFSSPLRMHFAVPPMPPLGPVDGVTVMPGDSTASDRSATSSAILESRRPANEIFAAFARQIAAAGWAPAPPATTAWTYAQCFMRNDGRHRWFAVLGAGRSSEERYSVTLDVTDLAEQ